MGAKVKRSIVDPARPAPAMRRLDHVLTKAPMWDQFATNQGFERLERELPLEQQQRSDHHGVGRRARAPVRSVYARKALGFRRVRAGVHSCPARLPSTRLRSQLT